MVSPLDTFTEVPMTATVIHPVAIKIDDDTKARVKRLAHARHRLFTGSKSVLPR
jgi:hypothetical protein